MQMPNRCFRSTFPLEKTNLKSLKPQRKTTQMISKMMRTEETEKGITKNTQATLLLTFRLLTLDKHNIPKIKNIFLTKF